MRHIPNIISLIRILMVGIFIGLFSAERYVAALAVYMFAFFSDVLDGQIARRYNWISNIGKLLDPLADKLMNLSALLCIFTAKHRGVYLTILLLVAFKELLMITGGLLLLKRRVIVYADYAGKFATGCFAVGTVLTLISLFRTGVEPWNIVILLLATFFSYYALVHYAVIYFLKYLKKDRVLHPPEPPAAA